MNSLANVYEHDMQMAAFAARLTLAGFAFDAARALPLRAHLQTLEAKALREAREAAGDPKLNVLSAPQMHRLFFGRFKAPILKRSEKTQAPSLDAEVLQQYAQFAAPEIRTVALSTMAYRGARKLRTTYIEAPIEWSRRDGRAHASWCAYGTVSGRLSCDDPNLMNLPKRQKDPTRSVDKGGIRGLYHAPAGRVLVSFDASQLEARIAAYFTGDAAMIRACESADFHATNAELLFGFKGFRAARYLELKSRAETSSLTPTETAELAALKPLRDTTKTSGFAIVYFAEPPTLHARLISEGHDLTLQQVETLMRSMRKAFHGYYTYQAAELKKIARSGAVFSPILGRRRFLGHEPSATEAGNFPVQSGAADFVNLRSLALEERLTAEFPSAMIVAQVHDALTIECAEAEAELICGLCHEVFEEPIEIGGRLARLPIEHKISQKWS